MTVKVLLVPFPSDFPHHLGFDVCTRTFELALGISFFLFLENYMFRGGFMQGYLNGFKSMTLESSTSTNKKLSSVKTVGETANASTINQPPDLRSSSASEYSAED